MVRSLSIRIEEEMLSKLVTSPTTKGAPQQPYTCPDTQLLKDFEAEHGKIEGSISPDENVKPPRKKQ